MMSDYDHGLRQWLRSEGADAVMDSALRPANRLLEQHGVRLRMAPWLLGDSLRAHISWESYESGTSDVVVTRRGDGSNGVRVTGRSFASREGPVDDRTAARTLGLAPAAWLELRAALEESLDRIAAGVLESREDSAALWETPREVVADKVAAAAVRGSRQAASRLEVTGGEPA